MWDLPGPVIEPVSPELAGGFLTNEPQGKSLKGIIDSVSLPGLKTRDVLMVKLGFWTLFAWI